MISHGTVCCYMVLGIVVVDNRGDLGQHIVDIFEHGAFRGSQVACEVDVSYNFLVLFPCIVKKAVQCLKGSWNYQ